jgi:hypothetical protein
MTPQPMLSARDLRRVMPGSISAHKSLIEAILYWCVLNRLPAVPVHTGPRVKPRPGGGFDIFGNPGQHGLADVIVVLPPFGRLVMVEAKTGRAHQSAAQRECHARLGSAGAMSVTVRNVEEMKQLLYQVATDRATASLARGERRQG